jgi:hypothetical protein
VPCTCERTGAWIHVPRTCKVQGTVEAPVYGAVHSEELWADRAPRWDQPLVQLMSLTYEPDWELKKERFLAWWAGEVTGRCAMSVTALREGAGDIAPPEYPSDPRQRPTDLDFISALNEYQHRTTFYGGEAFPVWHGGIPATRAARPSSGVQPPSTRTRAGGPRSSTRKATIGM